MVFERRCFSSEEIKKPYLRYFPFEEIPSNKDFEYGQERSIILRNEGGELERIKYRLSGAVPLSAGGYHWVFGDVLSTNYHACLVFNFKQDGTLDKITLSFCGRSPDFEEFKEITDQIRYPAEFTAFDPFKNIF